jgi:hypothetical protein
MKPMKKNLLFFGCTVGSMHEAQPLCEAHCIAKRRDEVDMSSG